MNQNNAKLELNNKANQDKTNLEKFYLNSLNFITTLPIAVMTTNGNIQQYVGGWKNKVLALEQDQKLRETLIERTQKAPVFIFNDLFNVYFGVCTWFDEKLLVIGPFASSTISSGVVRSYSIKHNTNIKPISVYSMHQMAAILVQAYFFVTNKIMDIHSIIDQSNQTDQIQRDINDQIMNVIMRHMEVITPHNDGSWEIIRRKNIMQGNISALNEHIQAPFYGMRGVIAKDPLRNIKNLAIVDITVSSRAALDAGLDSETVYTISDGYILKIEEVKNQSEAEQIANIAANEFAQLVKNLKSQQINLSASTNEAFVKAYNYINRNYNQKITIEDIAKETEASASFLQKIFKKELNQSIHECINKVRVKNSTELLNNKSLSISDIALLVGFSNSSHFIKEFKKYMKVTPYKYRKTMLNNYIIDINLDT